MKGFKHFFSVPPIHTTELSIRGIGIQEHMPPCMINRPTGTGDWLLMLFYDPVWIGTAGETARREPNSFMVWPPGERQYYGDRERAYDHTWIHCHGTFVQRQIAKAGLPTNQPVRLADPSIFERNLLAIHEELIRHAAPNVVIVQNLLENLFHSLSRAFRGEGAKPDIPDAFLAVRRFIELNFASPITLPELARQAGLSVPHFCAGFKRHFGVPAIEYVIRQRMHQAAYLLQDRNVRVRDVADRVGVESPYYFSRLFKKHFGVGPRAFRRNQETPAKTKRFHEDRP